MEGRGESPGTYDVHEAIVRHIVVGQEIYEDGQPKEEAIAFCVSRPALERYLVMARQAGIEVVGVNVESCAIMECFSRLFRRAVDLEHVFMFVDLGATSTQVVISHGPRMVFARNLRHGGQDFDRAAADALGIEPHEAHDVRLGSVKPSGSNADEHAASPSRPGAGDPSQYLERPLSDLTGQISGCLDHYEGVFGNRNVDRMVFTGGGAYDTWLCNQLALQLDLPGQIGNPLLNVRTTGTASQPDWTVAVGLSIGAGVAA